MIFTNLGIILGVYISTRIYRSQQQRYKLAPLEAPKEALPTANNKITDKHYFQISSATLLSASIGYYLFPSMRLINLGLITYTSIPILEQARHSLQQEKQLKNDSLSFIVTGMCVITGNYFAATVQNWVYHLGSHLVEKSKQHTTEQLAQTITQQPEKIWVLLNGTEISLPLERLAVGDILVVKTGEWIPVDGVIQNGRALIDQQIMTGEAQPVERHKGDTVLAETIVIAGSIEIRASHSGTDSQAQQFNKLLEQTRDYKSELQLKGEQWSDAMAKPLLLISAGTGLLFGLSPATALLFSAPTNTVRALLSLQTATHLQWATKNGILIKDGRVLEQLPWIDTILFDKTGTLTQTTPEVAQIVSCGELNPNQLLRIAATAEQHLQHPIAAAILNHANKLKLELYEIDDSHYDIGLGISVKINGKQVHVGSQRFIQEIIGDYRIPAKIDYLLHNNTGHSFIFIAVEKRLQGVIELFPSVRPEVPAVLEKLRQRGLTNIGIISGDQFAPTERLANSLGIQKVFAEILPQEKAALIRNLQQQGHRVCFIGDGINDALALKQANVSICLSSAPEISRNTAHIILLNDELTHLRDAFDLAVHLQIRLSVSLASWLGFGATNALLVPFGINPLTSSILYAGAFGLGFKNAKQAGWLDSPERNKKLDDDDVIESTASTASNNIKNTIATVVS
jgi:heavy metal translocating P-type ATPase